MTRQSCRRLASRPPSPCSSGLPFLVSSASSLCSFSRTMLGLRPTCSRLPSLAPARLVNSVSGVYKVRTLATVSSHSASEPRVADPSGYCRDYVRKRDYESYLIGSFYPRELQNAFFALRAFYVSIWSPCSPSCSGQLSVMETRHGIGTGKRPASLSVTAWIQWSRGEGGPPVDKVASATTMPPEEMPSRSRCSDGSCGRVLTI